MFKTVMHRRLAHIARALHLTIGKMIGIQQAKRFGNTGLQIAAIDLKGLHPPDINIPQIHRRVAAVHPFGKHHSGTTCRLNADRVKARGNKEILPAPAPRQEYSDHPA